MTSTQIIGQKVSEVRKNKGWTQERLKEILCDKLPRTQKVSRQWVANLENRLLKRTMSIERRRALSEILELDLSNVSNTISDTIQTSSMDQYDISVLIKHLASKEITALTFGQFRTLCEADYHCKQGGVHLSLLTNQETKSQQ